MIKMISTPAGSVSFHFLKPATLPKRKELKIFLLNIVRRETRKVADLSFVFCSDRHLLQMNQKFLNHDYFTDILTFPLDNAPGQISGEMYLSIDRIRENARDLAVPTERELHRVIFHGVLHLCGYKDKSSSDMKKMRSKENFYLKNYLDR